MTVPPLDAFPSAAPPRRSIAAPAAQRDRYQALLDAEVARLTHELRPRRQSAPINTSGRGPQPVL